MKPLVSAMFALCLLMVAAHEAAAHGGGLDGDGCHTETATGEYHCHGDEAGEEEEGSEDDTEE